MYLKRLELKGFKSFADKSVLTLEPGISAIVGPNGSGKSNICDAILWVLGERNAKSLRGSVMEDVIFAGSSERGAVSVAEVSLVLDNSDGTLPIEYSEVSLTRRLYRSGESEYLINDVSSRRLDVLDILHDSGLGTDTNSIISQGNLDSILQSKPIDRRALIEEAAGVLKHKQRKIRSEHKIDKMDHNLARIGDVMAEIERQLKPLRIKAKRAAAYDGLCAELSDLTLQLAVDDLKIIRKKWDEKSALKESLEEKVIEARQAYEKAEEALSQLRQQIANQSSDILLHSERQRRLNSVIEKLESIMMLLKEKATNAQRILDASYAKERSGEVSPAKAAVIDEIESTKLEIKNSCEDIKKLTEQIEESKQKLQAKQEVFQNAQKEHDGAVGANQDRQSEVNDIRKKLDDAQDSIIEAQSKTRMVEDRINNLENKIIEIKANVKSDDAQLKDKLKELNQTQKRSVDVNKQVEAIKFKLEKFQADKDSLNAEFVDLSSEIAAQNKILDSLAQQYSSAHQKLESNKEQFGIAAISDVIDVEEKYLPIVELVLGSYSQAYILKNDSLDIKEKLYSDTSLEGIVKFLSKANKHQKTILDSAKSAADEFGGVALYDKITFNNEDLNINIFDNVVAFSNTNDAKLAHNKYDNLITASIDGSIIFPDGRIILGRSFETANESSTDISGNVITYKKNLKKLTKKSKKIANELENVAKKISKYDNELHASNEENIRLQTSVAKLQGEADIFQTKYNNSSKLLEDTKSDLEASKNEQKLLREAYSSTAPEIERLNKRLVELESNIKTSSNNIQNLANKLDSARQSYLDFNESHNQITNKLVALKEHKAALDHILEGAEKRMQQIDEQENKNKTEIKNSQIIIDRTNTIGSIISAIEEAARTRLIKVDSETSDVNKRAKEIQSKSDAAIEGSNKARRVYEEQNTKLSDIKIELGRLEVQVQNAVDAIDAQDNISVDSALEMPDIEDRPGKEARAFKIRRRIANMGVINPEAKQDYENLKERYDFLNDQIEDLRQARISLTKITKIIDARMKDDFINTFEQVNHNFQEIFEVLFPGGHANLELDMPEDPENSGVEVKAQPKGKRISKMSLMSGGEKSLVALCLLFAVYKTRSTPFYILDEVEAALDDTNLRRLIKYLEDLCRHTQLIMITHQRRTMEMADVLYGVSMKANGITKIVSQKLDKSNTSNN